MIESIFIVFIFLNEFISFLYAGERLKLFDMISKRESRDDMTKQENRVLANLGIRFFLGLIYLGFLIYGLFVPTLFLYCMLTLVISVVTFIATWSLSKRGNSLKGRVRIARADAILTMLVWLTPFLKILKVVF